MNYKIPERMETDRLILRTFSEADWRDLHVLYSDEECVKYTIQRTLSEAESWSAMASMIGHWQLKGYGPYAVELKESGVVIGPVGMWYPHGWPEPEIKWALARQYWGKGYAAEAARAVKEMAESYLSEVHLISLIYSGNERSKALALSLGAKLEKDIEFRGNVAHIFRHSKSA